MLLGLLISSLLASFAVSAAKPPAKVTREQKAVLQKRNVAPLDAKNLVSYGPHDRFETHNVNLQFDKVYPFYFGNGNAGRLACQTFVFRTQISVAVSIWDCFCAGDSFAVYDSKSPLEILLRTGIECNVNDPTCSVYQENPDACWDNDALCKGTGILPPGFYNLTIETLTSPYGAGTGFIYVEPALEK